MISFWQQAYMWLIAVQKYLDVILLSISQNWYFFNLFVMKENLSKLYHDTTWNIYQLFD